MDVRTLFLAQTCALVATAAMLWLARSDTDRHNGLRTWTFAITAQGLAYLLLANAGRLPVVLSALLGNLLGAVSVALFFVSIRQFLGRGYSRLWLGVLVAAVTTAASISGADYIGATIFNGFAYGLVELLNGIALWRRPAPALRRVQRAVALLYLVMSAVLPGRALVLMMIGSQPDYLNMPADWQAPIYVFGFVYLIASNLGFLQLCKMRAEAEVRLQAMSDGLTGLANRRALNEAMAHALAAALRKRQPFAVLMVDLDHFKAINDRFGHGTGDATLAAFALRLRSGLRAQDQSFRYGGEEFCVLLPDTDAEGAVTLAERLRLHVGLPASGGTPALSASFGIAIWHAEDTADSLFGRADRALYRAKAAGRNRVEISQGLLTRRRAMRGHALRCAHGKTRRPIARAPRFRMVEDLDPAHEQEDDQDHHHQAEATARAVTPAAAVPPGRQGADQKQDEDDEQDGAECHEGLLVTRPSQ